VIDAPARDPELVAIETQIRTAVRDAVNRASRKPFYWGGLKGFQQLEAIAQVLHGMGTTAAHAPYFQQLTRQVDRALEQNRELAQGLQDAHTWLRRIAACLRYPPHAHPDFDSVSGRQIAQEMDTLLQQLRQQAQTGHQVLKTLSSAADDRWKWAGPDLLPCYDLPGLPPDNLQLESLFNRLRRHQRRINGRKSTQELRAFGQYQVLFMAESEAALLTQLRRVPFADVREHQQRLAQAEAPRQFFHRLHRDPQGTLQKLVARYAQRQHELTPSNHPSRDPPDHTV
jgi:hypothetical protein